RYEKVLRVKISTLTGAPATGLPPSATTATRKRTWPGDETQSSARIPTSHFAGQIVIELETVCVSPLGSRYSISARTSVGVGECAISVISVRAPPAASSVRSLRWWTPGGLAISKLSYHCSLAIVPSL